MAVKYLTYKNIDFSKWDRCISKSFNGNIYAYSWYLDIVCQYWEALVWDDYEIVMPLTIGKKYNIPYLFQPHFAQQLGIFSTTVMNEEIIEIFMNSIPERYRYVEINLNKYNQLTKLKGYQIQQNKTYELDLIRNYEHIYQNYSTNTKRNLKKAQENKLSIVPGISVTDVIEFKKKNSKYPVRDDHFDILKRLMSFALGHKFGEVYAVYDSNNELCSIKFFLLSHYKAILLSSASNEIGKQSRASFLLVDYFIKKFCERNLTLDFEGSNVESIARFYEGFGACMFTYLRLKQNNLPWLIKLFKA